MQAAWVMKLPKQGCYLVRRVPVRRQTTSSNMINLKRAATQS